VSDGMSSRLEAAWAPTLREPRVHRMLAHPLRYAIYMRLGEGPASTAELAVRLEETPKHVSRQVSELLREHLIEVVEDRPNSKGGPTYRAVDRHIWDAEEWASLPETEKANGSVTICRIFNEELGRALSERTFDENEHRALIRHPLWGDETAAEEISAIFGRAQREVAEVERRSAERNYSGQPPLRILTFLTSFLASSVDRQRSE
jgi:DNA-binding transcriptional ArsR family regulator